MERTTPRLAGQVQRRAAKGVPMSIQASPAGSMPGEQTRREGSGEQARGAGPGEQSREQGPESRAGSRAQRAGPREQGPGSRAWRAGPREQGQEQGPESRPGVQGPESTARRAGPGEQGLESRARRAGPREQGPESRAGEQAWGAGPAGIPYKGRFQGGQDWESREEWFEELLAFSKVNYTSDTVSC